MLTEEIAILVEPKAKSLADGVVRALKDKIHNQKRIQAAESVLQNLESRLLRTAVSEAYRFIIEHKIRQTQG